MGGGERRTLGTAEEEVGFSERETLGCFGRLRPRAATAANRMESAIAPRPPESPLSAGRPYTVPKRHQINEEVPEQRTWLRLCLRNRG